MIEATLGTLRATLQSVPMDWVLWAMDSRGVFRVYEGPGVGKGLDPEVVLGGSVWDLHRDDPRILSFVRRVMQEPCTELLVLNGYRFHFSGGPVEGGVAGIALAVGPVQEAEPDSPALGGRPVLELACPIPELGARCGDVLVPSEEEPDQAFLIKKVPLRTLPQPIRQEMSLLNSAPTPQGHSVSRGAARSLRERAPHLRLIS